MSGTGHESCKSREVGFVSLQFIYISSYLQLGAFISLIGISQFSVHLASIPVWLFFVRRYGKHLPWALSSFAMAATAPVLLVLPPGHASLIPMVAISGVAGFLSASNAISPQSILAVSTSWSGEYRA